MTSTTDPFRVRLGLHRDGTPREYVLEEQSLGRIGRKLGAVVAMFQAQTGGGDGFDTYSERLHEALEVFIPEIAPLWELSGWPSEQALAEHRAAVEQRDRDRDEFARGVLAPDVGELHEDRAEVDRLGWGDLTDEQREGWQEVEVEDPRTDASDRQTPKPTEIIDTVDRIFHRHGGSRLLRLLKAVIDPAVIRKGTSAYLLDQARLNSASVDLRIARLRRGASDSTSSTTTGPTSPEASEPSAGDMESLSESGLAD